MVGERVLRGGSKIDLRVGRTEATRVKAKSDVKLCSRIQLFAKATCTETNICFRV